MSNKWVDGLTNGAEPFERWVGLPTKPGQRLHGLSRSAIYQGISNNRIRTACIKMPGKLSGKRLVWEKSVVDYIESFIEHSEVK